MNKTSKFASLILAGLLALALAPLGRAQAVNNPRNSRGEQFFIISSVDQQKHQVVLMAPTQLTLVAQLTPQTVCINEQGRQIDAKQIKAGDTVWVTLRSNGGQATALRIREGAMTPEELRALYLHSPSGMATPAAAPARQPRSSPAAAPNAPGASKAPAANPTTPPVGAAGMGARRMGTPGAGAKHRHHPGSGQIGE